jgi:hypothetical protein
MAGGRGSGGQSTIVQEVKAHGEPLGHPTAAAAAGVGRADRLVTRLRRRQEWQFFGVLHKADPGLAVAWWVVLVARGLLPVGFAVATGALVGAVQGGSDLAGPLVAVGVAFVLLQVLRPLHQAIGTTSATGPPPGCTTG